MKANHLPDDFWALPEDAVSEAKRQIYNTLVERMRDEFAEMPGYGVLEQMLIERVCYLYIHIKDKESSTIGTEGGFAHDRAYKETLQLWQSMAGDVRKAKTVVVDADQIRDVILQHVNETMQSVLDSFHPDVAAGLRVKFAEAFENANL